MFDRYKIEARDAKLVIGLIGAGCVAISVAFYFISQAYYDDRMKDGAAITDAHIRGVRVSFTIFMLSLSAVACGATLAPRVVGHSLGIAAGVLALLGGGVAMSQHEIHIVLPIALLVTAAIFAHCTQLSFRGSRAGWAFLVAMCAVFSVVTLFGATKIRTHLDIGIYYALIVPGLLAVATIALTLLRREYREST